MTAGSELGLWWYFWYVLAGGGKYHHRPTTEPEMPAGLIYHPPYLLHFLKLFFFAKVSVVAHGNSGSSLDYERGAGGI